MPSSDSPSIERPSECLPRQIVDFLSVWETRRSVRAHECQFLLIHLTWLFKGALTHSARVNELGSEPFERPFLLRVLLKVLLSVLRGVLLGFRSSGGIMNVAKINSNRKSHICGTQSPRTCWLANGWQKDALRDEQP